MLGLAVFALPRPQNEIPGALTAVQLTPEGTFPCDAFCEDHAASWYDKCYWTRCFGCGSCEHITPPEAAGVCDKLDTWTPAWQPVKARVACETWATDHEWGALRPVDGVDRTLQTTCASSDWARENCAFTCCVAGFDTNAKEEASVRDSLSFGSQGDASLRERLAVKASPTPTPAPLPPPCAGTLPCFPEDGLSTSKASPLSQQLKSTPTPSPLPSPCMGTDGASCLPEEDDAAESKASPSPALEEVEATPTPTPVPYVPPCAGTDPCVPEDDDASSANKASPSRDAKQAKELARKDCARVDSDWDKDSEVEGWSFDADDGRGCGMDGTPCSCSRLAALGMCDHDVHGDSLRVSCPSACGVCAESPRHALARKKLCSRLDSDWDKDNEVEGWSWSSETGVGCGTTSLPTIAAASPCSCKKLAALGACDHKVSGESLKSSCPRACGVCGP